MRAEQKGVTLIELLTVMAVVAILGSIALSSYRTSIIRTNRADATTALLRLAGQQEKLYMVNNTYSNTAGLALIGLTNTDRGYYTITIAPDPGTGLLTTGFQATATPVAGGPQAVDTICTSLTLDNNGQRTNTGTGVPTDCWK